jgi:hypothetical protein
MPNPYQTPNSSSHVDHDSQSSDAGTAYNIVSDVFTGVNIRKRDNLWQATFILISVCLFAGLGALIAWINPNLQLPWFGGAMIGGFTGLVVGVIASGIYLMLYRAAMHLRGKHR